MTRQEIEQRMDELACEYHDIHEPEIPEEIYRFSQAAWGDGTLKAPGSRSEVRSPFSLFVCLIGCKFN